jgi:sensor histidine kinase YesM
VILSLYCTTFIVFSNVLRILESEGRLDRSALDVYFLVVGLYFVVVLAIALKLFRLTYEKENQNLLLLREKTEAELELLRSQINPHFLFNTLNSIYTLSMKKSDQAPEVVLKLSEMLDYLLYETSAPRVHLNKELQLIRNYIYLQKIRFYKQEPAILKIKSDTGTYFIAPMLLLPFVENAFKHGPGMTKNADISINIEIRDNKLQFRTKNSIAPDTKKHGRERGGIGLSNVKKRLDIQYPEQYTLQMESDEKTFRVFLALPLNNAEKI